MLDLSVTSLTDFEYLKLGASLYVPATHQALTSIVSGRKFPTIRSLIIDTEDSIGDGDLDAAYRNIRQALIVLGDMSEKKFLLFIRARDPVELQKLLEIPGLHLVDGIVLPKFSESTMEDYMSADVPVRFLMPILEKDIFHLENIINIRNFLIPHRPRILSIRIGATDLLSSLGLRRNETHTIYDIQPINRIIADIILTFKPYHFNITAPVWESFNPSCLSMLKKEVRLDLLNGLFGKTVIHPWQVDVVQALYKISRAEFEAASRLLEKDCPPVFKLDGMMHENATHSNWAKVVLERARIYGITNQIEEGQSFEADCSLS